MKIIANSTDNATNAAAAPTTGSGTTNYIPKWLSSSSLGNSFLYQTTTTIGFGTTTPVAKFQVVGSTPATAIDGYNNATSGNAFGMLGQADSTAGTGIYGKAAAASGATIGVRGTATSTTGTGILGQDTATSGATAGVSGQVSSAAGVAGVFNNTAGGKILSGRSTRNGSNAEIFSVDGAGNAIFGGSIGFGSSIRSGSIIVQSDGTALTTYSDSLDGIIAHTFDSSAIHAYGGQSYSTAAITAEGGQVPALLATSDNCQLGPPCVVIRSGTTNTSAACVMDNFGNLTCTGTKSAAVDTASGRKLAMYAVESPENWFEDFGSAQLSSGAGSVKLDSVLTQTVIPHLTITFSLRPTEIARVSMSHERLLRHLKSVNSEAASRT